ncbi:TorF family putative porin [Halarcobacter anaerophilus]|uniref:TorF family putative porin n=1 Tax=Halarcobacter anaerophilus TaxID=877500 RepID=UPI0005CA5D1E|nr:TorF family putative porin [Halarcobacter anaerophilus]
MEKRKNIILSLIVASSIATFAQAQELGITTSITATNNYVSRGMTQTDDKGAVFGEVTLSYENFYTGLWASNVEFEGADADSELDVYIGYATSIGNFNIDTHYVRYYYPNSEDVMYYDEAVLDLNYTFFDKLTLGGAYYWGTHTENNGDKLDYYEGYASYDFDAVTAHASAGDYENIGDNYSIGLTKSFTLSDDNTLTLDLTYANYNADSSSGYDDEDNLYATITYTF